MHQPLFGIVPGHFQACGGDSSDPEVAGRPPGFLPVGDKLEDFSLLGLAHLVLSKDPQVVDGPGPQPGDQGVGHGARQDVLLALGEPLLCKASKEKFT